MVKQELNSEEKFFEKAVITEKFIKKYKNLLIVSIVVVITLVVANIAYDVNSSNKITEANKALAILQKDATNTQANSELKSLSPELYDAWRFSQAVANKDLLILKELQDSKALLISDISKYELAQSEQSIEKLDSYALTQDAIFKDLALVQSAIILMNNNKVDEAREKLSNISNSSPLLKLSKVLMHYGIK
jgi:predicted negative regulator of RcsB-dependent stress response